jgi:fumarate hydratase class II
MKQRTEHDSLGKVQIDDKYYYGVNTFRAIENFKVSGFEIPLEIIKAIALIKIAYAEVNTKNKIIDSRKASKIVEAGEEILKGKFNDQFPLDVFQTGSGTSTNMNANEVIANRAIEILGGKKGDKSIIHPNDDVNKGQSSNDVFPSSIQIALSILIREELMDNLTNLKVALKKKEEEFKNVIKAGRTHLMDALPVTLGQEFSAYASQIEHSIKSIKFSENELHKLPLGGTAVGTGFGTTRKISRDVVKFIKIKTGINFSQCQNFFEGLSSKENLLNYSSALKRCSVALMKISEDLRLMASGPKCGLSEIEIPSLQAGSSIMAGKVNPVILEMTQMVSSQVIGFDFSNTICAMGGRFELNVMMPLLAYNLITATKILSNTVKILNEKCISGIRANTERCKFYAESTPSIVTFLQPYIGYDKATSIYKESLKKNVPIREIILKEKFMTEKELNKILNPKKLTKF